MNRDIKFRVWHKDLKFLCLPCQIDFCNKSVDLLTPDEPMYDVNFNDIIFMQYTGLKDVNGVEIYEGDIVKSMEFGGINFEIIWDNDNACFVGENNSIKGMEICLNETIKYSMYNLQFGKVIRNIYENPELLEGDNQ